MELCKEISGNRQTQPDHLTMKNVSHKKTWNLVMTQMHVEPPPTPQIKTNHEKNPDRDLVKLKLRRYPTSYLSDIYVFNMAFFDNGELEEFLLLVKT